jgi:hypothetical protein
MKRLYIILVVLLFIASPIYGLTYDAADNSTFFNGYAWGGHPQKDRAWQWAQDVQDLSEIGFQLGTGEVFYVDSGQTASGAGTSWSTAFITLDEAFATGKCTANRGDFVLVAQGHNEALTGADGVDIDVAGVTVIGCGNGSLKPTFDYDAAGGEFVIGAANVRIENLRFRASANAITKAIDVESAGLYAQIIGCEFGYVETITDEFTVGIIVNSIVSQAEIAGCYFDAGGQAAGSAISFADVVGISIHNNMIFGDYSTACIANSVAADEIMIYNNVLLNGTMGGDGEINTVAAISLPDDASGIIGHNDVISDVATSLLMVVADDAIKMQNIVSDTDGDEFSGSPEYGYPYTIGGSTATGISAHVDG